MADQGRFDLDVVFTMSLKLQKCRLVSLFQKDDRYQTLSNKFLVRVRMRAPIDNSDHHPRGTNPQNSE